MHNKYLETFDSSLNKHLETYASSCPVGYNSLPHIGSTGIRPTAVKLPETISIRKWLVEEQQQTPLFGRCLAIGYCNWLLQLATD